MSTENTNKYLLLGKSDLVELIQSIYDNVKNKYATKTFATELMPGMMSSADKAKLNGIDEGANRYIHPNNSGHKHIPPGGKDGQILRWVSDGTAEWADETFNKDNVLTSEEIQDMVDDAFK